MNNQIDKFFRDKLEGHAVEPEANAWSRIASGLPKKNNSIIWLSAAAALIIVSVASILVLSSTEGVTVSPTLSAKDTNATDKVKQPTPATSKSKEIPPSKPLPPNPVAKASKTRDKKVQKKSASAIPQEQIAISVDIPEITLAEVVTIDETSLNPVKSDEATKPIVIVYELKDVVRKPESTFDIDFSPQRKNGFKKVLEVANDVRTGESPLTGLRQAKEEILAFNFKKEDKNNK